MKLLTWQWSGYARAHRDRRNLLVHLVTMPVFATGVSLLAAAPFRPVLALAGIGAIGVAVAAQKRSHAFERVAPVPFRSPMDLLVRLFAEQLVTFPRFVLSGRFAEAWRADSEG